MQDGHVTKWLTSKTGRNWRKEFRPRRCVWLTPIWIHEDDGVIAVWPTKCGGIQVHAIPTSFTSVLVTLEALKSVSEDLDGLKWLET